jgi:hypothetical protein
VPGQEAVLRKALAALSALERLHSREPAHDRSQSPVAVAPDPRAVRANLVPVGEICIVRFKTDRAHTQPLTHTHAHMHRRWGRFVSGASW